VRERAATYHRASTLDQDAALAREELRRAAEARGYEIVEVIEEHGSGARNDRPGLLHVLDLARRGAIDVVVCWKLDRFGRSALDLLANIRALGDAGVRFIAITQGLDIKPVGDPMSRLLVTMLAAVAEFERDLIIERTKLGVSKARSRGVRLGRPPALGPMEARLVALRREQGASWRSIAREIGCTPSAARRAAGRAAGPVEQGVLGEAPLEPEKPVLGEGAP
jgi:putative DNA-invertase from lambdoid prophage Rac